MGQADLEERLDRFASLVERARTEGCEAHGRHHHEFILGSGLSERHLRRFERQRGHELPVEYRAFLRRFGDHGPAPHYGLQRLDDAHGLEVEAEFLVVGDQGCAYVTLLELSGPTAGRLRYRNLDRPDDDIVLDHPGWLSYVESWIEAVVAGRERYWAGTHPPGTLSERLALADDPAIDDERRADAIRSLTVSDRLSDEIHACLVRQLSHSSPRCRRAALSTLRDLDAPDVAPLAEPLIDDSDIDVATLALRLAVEPVDSVAMPGFLATALRSPRHEIERAALSIATDHRLLDDAALRDHLRVAVDDRVRFVAISHIDWGVDDEATIAELLESPSRSIRQRAIRLAVDLELVGLHGLISRCARSGLEAGDPSMARTCLRAAAELDAAATADLAVDFLDTDADLLRIAAVEQLCRLGDERVLWTARALLAEDRRPWEGRNTHPRTIPELVRPALLGSPSARLSRLAVGGR